MSLARILTAAAIILSSANYAVAADVSAGLPVKAPAPADNAPFYTVNDNRLSLSYLFTGISPGNPGRTAKTVVTFTHFDEWAYGSNLINLDLIKSSHNEAASPCPIFGTGCAGATEFAGLIRSTLGFNQIFNTRAFSIGPLRNVSFEAGVDGEVENQFLAPAKVDVVAGLQFAFDLPYRGYINVAPLVYKEWGHNSFLTPSFTGPVPGIIDGNTSYRTTWALETNYYMDLGFLPDTVPLAISGRANWIGPKGTGTSLIIPSAVPTRVELNTEPIRLTLDASKVIWGQKYAHFVDVWVAYRLWQNKFGLDSNKSGACIGLNANSCSGSSAYTGVTVKF